MPLNLFYTMVQKSQKWPKTQIKGGSCLNTTLAKKTATWIVHKIRTLFLSWDIEKSSLIALGAAMRKVAAIRATMPILW